MRCEGIYLTFVTNQKIKKEKRQPVGEQNMVDNPQNIKKFRWRYDENVKVLWRRLTPFLKDIVYKITENFNFNIDRYTVVSEYARSCVFVFPLSKDENYCIAYHITEREWVCPHTKAYEHLSACINRINKIYKWEKRKIKNITINLFGNYTRNVSDNRLTKIAKQLCKERGLTTKVVVFVYRDENALKQSAEKIVWFLKTRISRFKEVLARKGIKAFGIVKERINTLALLAEGFTLLFIKDLAWHRFSQS